MMPSVPDTTKPVASRTQPVRGDTTPSGPALVAPLPVTVLPLPKPGGGAQNAKGEGHAQGGGLRPPVKRSFARVRHFLITLSFMVCVITPATISGIYLWAVAVDQYASSVGFTVRREDAGSPTDVLSGLTNFSGASSTDTDILFEYLQSQKLISEMDAEIGLRDRWSRPAYDPVFAIKGDASIEQLVEYWENMVRVSYGTGAGLIEVEVRAFDPGDATVIAETLFDKSSQMINDLSSIAREDGIRYTNDELVAAEDRLRDAREALTRFRNVNQIVDPEMDLRSQAGLLAKLQEQKAAALIDLDLLGRTAQETDPRAEQAQRRLEVIDARISQERLKLGGSGQLLQEGDRGFADIIGEYEGLAVDREFAQEAYISARASHDSALSEANRKSRYLAAYMEPTRAQTAAYPERITLQIVITLFLFLLWSISVLVYYSVKDRR
jgi:capsular polysaccharide transport system permease protein